VGVRPAGPGGVVAGIDERAPAAGLHPEVRDQEDAEPARVRLPDGGEDGAAVLLEGRLEGEGDARRLEVPGPPEPREADPGRAHAPGLVERAPVRGSPVPYPGMPEALDGAHGDPTHAAAPNPRIRARCPPAGRLFVGSRERLWLGGAPATGNQRSRKGS